MEGISEFVEKSLAEADVKISKDALASLSSQLQSEVAQEAASEATLEASAEANMEAGAARGMRGF